ncbi:MAG: enoyl-CoA hydratase/isomerase family protein [Alphaproteobacteria bacterium]|nr:enoyl-CoA hydratase/isomerase family protein [Alphaproteobacteria bacterium]
MAEVDVRVEGAVGRITLNRPDALNALNRPMMDAIDGALVRWAGDAAVCMVIIDAIGDRSFCAGGDINELYHRTKAGDLAFSRKFWRDEYRMNARINSYPKPYVAVMDGITMGGGVGLSAHGSHRIVTERSMVAMPECGIGLIPDVGGTFLLGHAPGRLGEFLGLTGARMAADDAIHAGFADVYVPSETMPDLIEALVDEADVRPIERFAERPPEGKLVAQREVIDVLFAGEDLRAIAASVDAAGSSDWLEKVNQALARACPLSMHAALSMIRAARGMTTLEEALVQEYRYTWRSLEEGEFMEGIRAAVIDKDREPRWAKPGIGDVTAADVEAMLSSLGDNELTF